MNIKNLMAGLSVAAIALMTVPSAWSASSVVNAHIAFDTPLSVSTVSDINFGTVQAGLGTSATYTISPTGATSNTAGAFLFGSPLPGQVTIAGSTSQAVQINTVLTPSAHVTLANATCKYGAAAAGSCAISNAAAPGAATTMYVGVDATVAPGTPPGSETPTITITVTY